MKNTVNDNISVSYERNTEALPLVINGIKIPPECEDIWINELKFKSNKIQARIINVLLREGGIWQLRDFRGKNIELEKIKYVGAVIINEFETAIKKAIENTEKTQ